MYIYSLGNNAFNKEYKYTGRVALENIYDI